MMIFITSVQHFEEQLSECEHDYHYFTNLEKAIEYVTKRNFYVPFEFEPSRYPSISTIFDSSMLKIEHRLVNGNSFIPDIVQMSRSEENIFDTRPLYKVYTYGDELFFLPLDYNDNEDNYCIDFFMKIKVRYCD